MDPELAAIDAAMTAQGKSRAEMARLLGLDSSQVTKTLQGIRRLQRHEYAKLVEWLNLPGATGRVGGTVIPLPNMIPLYGWATAASGGELVIAEPYLRGYIPMHPNQQHAKDAFALEVPDVTSSPRYEPGEIIYMAPNRWPSRNQDCVLVTRNGHAWLGRYITRDGTSVTLQQLEPRKDLSFEMDDVEVLHSVVGRG
jgi:phage repressor protein C with HTH and peptisase S24 domain